MSGWNARIATTKILTGPLQGGKNLKTPLSMAGFFFFKSLFYHVFS